MVEKLFSGLFLKNQNWAYFWIKFYIVCFYCMPSWGLSKDIETKLQTTCFLRHMKPFFKKKVIWNWPPASFSARFLKKNISHAIFSCLAKFHCLVVFTSWDLAIICIAIVCLPSCDVIHFEINPISLMNRFFLHDQKVKTKIKYLENEKSF